MAEGRPAGRPSGDARLGTPQSRASSFRDPEGARRTMEDWYGITDADRQELLDWIATLRVPPALQKTLARGVELETLVEAWCPDCDRPVKVRHPQLREAAQFIKLLMEFKLQKPSELRQVDVNVRQIRAREELEQLSDAELLAIEEGEWQPLPPAA